MKSKQKLWRTVPGMASTDVEVTGLEMQESPGMSEMEAWAPLVERSCRARTLGLMTVDKKIQVQD